MARQPSPSARTTVYRLVGLTALADGIRRKYLDGDDFNARVVAVGDREALLVSGSMITEQASWTSRVEQLTGVPVDVGNRTSAGVLLIRDEQDSA